MAVDNSELLRRWKKEEQATFTGWDFSYLGDRYFEESPPWDYPSIARNLVGKSASMLDMDTGGGEILSSLVPFAGKAVAIEGYHPNVAVAAERLGPLGVRVFECSGSGPLPFDDGEFDLVLNRHGAFEAGEVARVLANGGTFLTQQVGAGNLEELERAFGIAPNMEHTAANIAGHLSAAGLEVRNSREWTGKTTFADVGAVVYFLKAIPWIVEGFGVDSHLEYLMKLQETLNESGILAFTVSRFLIVAQKT